MAKSFIEKVWAIFIYGVGTSRFFFVDLLNFYYTFFTVFIFIIEHFLKYLFDQMLINSYHFFLLKKYTKVCQNFIQNFDFMQSGNFWARIKHKKSESHKRRGGKVSTAYIKYFLYEFPVFVQELRKEISIFHFFFVGSAVV